MRKGLWMMVLMALISAVPLAGAFEVQGWGQGTLGGTGGRVLIVTRLDDDVRAPAPGMLRWALLQKGPRIIRFGVEGDLTWTPKIGLVVDL
jgi:hypothetical protein